MKKVLLIIGFVGFALAKSQVVVSDGECKWHWKNLLLFQIRSLPKQFRFLISKRDNWNY